MKNYNFEEEDYPSAFSFDEFKAIPSYAGRLRYAAQHLKKLSSGTSRVVYEVDDDKVLKIAKNRKGLAQNAAESDWGAQNYDIVARVYDADYNDHFYVEMEKAKKVTPNTFKNFFGFTLDQLQEYLRYQHYRMYRTVDQMKQYEINPQFVEFMDDYEYVQDLMHFIYDFNLPIPGDFGRASTWGEVEDENGRKRLVLVDFGFSNDAASLYS